MLTGLSHGASLFGPGVVAIILGAVCHASVSEGQFPAAVGADRDEGQQAEGVSFTATTPSSAPRSSSSARC
jgi:hypothetical protein